MAENSEYQKGSWTSALRAFLRESGRVLREHKRGLWALIGVVFVILVFVMVFTYKIIETPWFCGVCHNMDPYVASWKASSHRHVACVECHYKPGFINHLKGKWKDGQVSLVYFITGKVVTRPHAEIADESCTQCHPKDKLKDNLVFKNVLFSHSKHLAQLRRGKKLRCTTCHSQIVQGKHITVTEDNCFICHFNEYGKETYPTMKCGTCHFAPKGEIIESGVKFNHRMFINRKIPCESCHTNVVKGDGHLRERACLQCHNKREILEAKYSPQFMHENHVTNHKVECYYCHTVVKHEIQKISKKKIEAAECGTCHGEGVHKKIISFYLGEGGYKTKSFECRMAKLNLDCRICHSKHGGISDIKRKCVECHGKVASNMLENWESYIGEREKKLFSRILEVKSMVERTEAPNQRAKELLQEAIYNYNLVEIAKPVHNPVYALRLINSSYNMLEEAISYVKKNYKPKYRTFTMSCTLCHPNIAEEEVPFGSVNFPHEAHVEDESSCKSCHSSYENHGQTFLVGCSSCHHGEGTGEVKCTDCHRDVYKMYAGTGGVGVEKRANPMHAKVNCQNCHKGVVEEGSDNLSMIEAQCSSCHKKKNVAKTLDGWLRQEASDLKKLNVKIMKLEKEMRLLEMKNPDINPLREIFWRIEQNYKLLKNGRMIHNFGYASSIEEAINRDADVLQKMIDAMNEGKPIQVEIQK